MKDVLLVRPIQSSCFTYAGLLKMEFVKLRLSLSQVFQHPVSDCVMQLGFHYFHQYSALIVTRPRMGHQLGLSAVSGVGTRVHQWCLGFRVKVGM